MHKLISLHENPAAHSLGMDNVGWDQIGKIPAVMLIGEFAVFGK